MVRMSGSVVMKCSFGAVPGLDMYRILQHIPKYARLCTGFALTLNASRVAFHLKASHAQKVHPALDLSCRAAHNCFCGFCAAVKDLERAVVPLVLSLSTAPLSPCHWRLVHSQRARRCLYAICAIP